MVKIEGLIVPTLGRNSVAKVVATLVCGQMLEGSTAPFDLSTTTGNGSTSDVISAPRDCESPAVLIQPAGNRAAYIASTVDEDKPGTEG